MNPWLTDRRWMWRVVVLVIALVVMALLVWRGMDPLAAAGSTLAIFVIIAVAVGHIIDSPGKAAPPAAPGIPDVKNLPLGETPSGVAEPVDKEPRPGEVAS